MSPVVTAGPGSIDPSFGTGGYSTVIGPVDIANARQMAVMNDGKIVVVGDVYEDDEGQYDLVVERFLANGAYDRSFDGGRVVTNIITADMYHSQEERGSDHPSVVAVQADGKILVSGYSRYYDDQSVRFVIRYHVDGSVDTSFGKNGRVIAETGLSASTIIVLGDGKILLAGTAPVDNGYGGFTVTRLNSDGSEDKTFAANGKSFRPGRLRYTPVRRWHCSRMGKLCWRVPVIMMTRVDITRKWTPLSCG